MPICWLFWRLNSRGKQAIFNLDIKKKFGLSINSDIHHSKVFSSGQPKILTNCSYWVTSPTNKFGFNPFVCQFNIQCFRCITSCTNVRTLSTTSTEFRIFLTYCQKFLPSICTVCLNLSSCLALKPRRVCLKIENYHEVVLFWISWWKGLKKYRFLIKISFNRSK